MHRIAPAAGLMFAAALSAAAQEFTVAAGDKARVNVPIRAVVLVPAGTKSGPVIVTPTNARKIGYQGQLADPGLLAELPNVPTGMTAKEVHFILPKLEAGKEAAFEFHSPGEDSPFAKPGFAWHDTKGESMELRFQDRPVLRYMYKAIDESSKAAREQTYKVFHHLFDLTGTKIVTKGPGGQFTHHRGIFYGFNKVTYGEGKKCDVWHCTGDAHQSHERFVASEAGPVMGRHTVEIAWHGAGKEVFARELRELTVYNIPDPIKPQAVVVEFASKLVTTGGTVKLDGDPQHAGFHFRADNEVNGRKAETYYVRPDGAGKPGETRNWPNLKTHVNLPWDCMSFMLGQQRYTVTYLDRPTNPKEARFSEREYGRFGSYFEYELTAEKPLKLQYRLWLDAGETNPTQAAERSADFLDKLVK